MNRSSIRQQRILFAALYFSEGAPIGFIWWALPAQLRLAKLPIEDIALLTSVLVFPWTLKFLWAPLVDVLSNERWTLKHWVYSAQFMMAASLAPLFFLDYSDVFPYLFTFLLLHAVAAATQDVAIDALAIRTVAGEERGKINGWMQAGMLLGRSLFGGASLALITQVDKSFVLALLIAAILSSALLLAQFPVHAEQAVEQTHRRQRMREFFARLRRVITTRSTRLGFLVAVFGGAAFEGTGAVAGPFLIDRGFTAETVGMFFGIPVVIAMMGGSLLGGFAADRLKKRTAVGAFIIYIVIIVIATGLIDAQLEGPKETLFAMLTLLYFGIGLFTAASYAFFMEITEPAVAATQFSAFMGATNLCESWSAFVIGRMAGGFGYPVAFIGMSVFSLLALPALAAFKRIPSRG